MKTTYAVLAIMLMAANAFGQTATDEKEVRAVIQKMEDSYNAHDYSFSGKYDILDPDALFINPVGMYWKDRSEIQQAVPILGEMRLKYETGKYTIKDIHFLAPSVALAVVVGDGRVEQDYNFPDGTRAGTKGEETHAMYSFTLTKKGKDWKIASMQITHIDPIAAKMNPIKTNQ